MKRNEIETATREQLADELAAACAYTEDWQTTTMDDLRERVSRVIGIGSVCIEYADGRVSEYVDEAQARDQIERD